MDSRKESNVFHNTCIYVVLVVLISETVYLHIQTGSLEAAVNRRVDDLTEKVQESLAKSAGYDIVNQEKFRPLIESHIQHLAKSINMRMRMKRHVDQQSDSLLKAMKYIRAKAHYVEM